MKDEIKIGLNKTTILVVLAFLVISVIYYLGRLSMDLDLKPLTEGNIVFTLIQFLGIFGIIFLFFMYFSNKAYFIMNEKGIYTTLMHSNNGWIEWNKIEKIGIKNNPLISFLPFNKVAILEIYLKKDAEKKDDIISKLNKQHKIVVNLNDFVLKIADFNEIQEYLNAKTNVEVLNPGKK